MADNEKIISKIKKILELSRNNPSKEEAESAAAKAQLLMAQYHLELADVEGVEDTDDIFEIEVNCGKGNKWKYALAGIVAKNFRCKHFYYGKERVVFYGYQTDAEIAAMTFETLFNIGNKDANNYYQKLRNKAIAQGFKFYGDGIKNSYLIGYLEGIQSVLEKQCTALMIVTPTEIVDKFNERVAGSKTMHNSGLRCRGGNSGDVAREEGRISGKCAAGQRSISSM